MAFILRQTIKPLFLRQVALPSEHGAWVFLLSPILIGVFIAGRMSVAFPFTLLAALTAFLIRQPVTIVVKIYSGRRSTRDLKAAWFWTIIYGLLCLLAVAGLMMQGYSYILLLAIPGVPVFIWHLLLISRRAERRQMGVEIVASGVLALSAPAVLWVSLGKPDLLGWWLWLLIWLQSAASIVHAYMRLNQRQLSSLPDLTIRLAMGRQALLYTSFNLAFASGLALEGSFPALLPLPFALQWAETLWGTLKPAIGYRPTRIGIRQLVVSTLFTLLFILAWKI